MSLNDEIDAFDNLLHRIESGFWEMRNALQHIQELNVTLRGINTECDRESIAWMQALTKEGNSSGVQNSMRAVDNLNQRLQDLQKLEELPHWVFQQWPNLTADISSLDATPMIAAQHRQNMQDCMDMHQQLIRQQVEQMYHLIATIRYKTIETMDMLEQPT
ncbi:hypothetical protein MCOR25_006233 [Pyricularia grisea]|uniref:Uncharacterized protein n=1 Tax=Pyricularia grisea TaxID=148305 RepID=A0A6P8AT94_PYRGI|nr:uncharacterized protein PgNI_09105 [Pyricularia grisea]KAI6362358.1 hypothetical protein MCOR25_006233 [Pyricularia grisea]TLD05351.1 hypothetical protein PgNI_09105 [Pyricularia grisea]